MQVVNYGILNKVKPKEARKADALIQKINRINQKKIHKAMEWIHCTKRNNPTDMDYFVKDGLIPRIEVK